MTSPSTPHRKAQIGTPPNFWLHSSLTGFDLRRPPTTSPTLTLRTSTSPIAINASSSALVIIDMQNFFLSPSLGRDPKSAGSAACRKLIDLAIPAARSAGMRVLWVNWGVAPEEVGGLPPGVRRAFGFHAVVDSEDASHNVVAGAESEGGVAVDKHGNERESGVYKGIGAEMGRVSLSDSEGGGEVDAGRLLVRASWNADLYAPLRTLYDEGRLLPRRPDVWIHKNRMSGLWGATTPLQEFLESEGITTLLFAGVNTDQCVGGTLTDAFSRGYDCILLSDGCGTSSPGFAQECWEYNAAHTFGFCCSCEDLARGVAEMQ